MFKRIVDSVIPPSGGQRFPALDGFRACAALGVVLLHSVVMYQWHPVLGNPIFHAAMWKLGAMAVSTFFVLSAFLLFYPVAAGKQFSTWTYFKRRIFRIMPAYLTLMLLAYILLVSTRNHIHADAVITRLFFLSGLKREWGNILLDGTWSLAPEVHFYVLLPLLILIVGRSFWRVGALVALGLGLQFVMQSTDGSSNPADSPSMFLPFFFGMAAALAVAKFEKHGDKLAFLGPLGLLILYLYPLSPVFGLLDRYTYRPGFIAAMAQHQPLLPALKESLLIALASPRGLWPALGGGMAVVGLTAGRGFWAKLLSGRFIRALGITSYGTFLFNWPIFFLLFHLSHHRAGIVMLGIPLAVVFGISSYLLVEAPAMRFVSRKSKPRVAPAPAPAPTGESQISG